MSDTEKKELVDKVIEEANELSEVWTNTTTGYIINNQRDHVEELARFDINLAHIAALELQEFCESVSELN